MTPTLIDSFVLLSGDCSPLHINDSFARERGFLGRVAHGALLGALVSGVIGTELPGDAGAKRVLERHASAVHAIDFPDAAVDIDTAADYAKLLDEETVIIKQVVPSHPEYECIERLADQIGASVTCYGRPYRIVRIFCGSYSGNSVAAYTNSLILNRKVLVRWASNPFSTPRSRCSYLAFG